jgi:hypothetical protein
MTASFNIVRVEPTATRETGRMRSRPSAENAIARQGFDRCTCTRVPSRRSAWQEMKGSVAI